MKMPNDAKNPLISIVLPTYNGARYLAESIQSCINQIYTNWELFIIYDESTDISLQIIQNYAKYDKRIRCNINSRRNRLPGALNTGFMLAKGEYLTWISDDNLFLPLALSTMLEKLTAHADIDFVYSDYLIINETGQTIDYYRVAPPDQFIVGQHYLQSFLYRRRVYEVVGFYSEDLFLAEDFDYWLRIYANKLQMVPIHQSLYLYRRHSHSLSDQHKKQVFPVTTQVLYRYLQYQSHSRNEIGQIFLYLASLASWQGNKKLAASLLLIASLHTPVLACNHLLQYIEQHSIG